jgi:hypothetical protein
MLGNRCDSSRKRPLLPPKAVAVAVIEPMLFAIYGKKNIIRQLLYEGHLVDGGWYLSGTLLTGWIGEPLKFWWMLPLAACRPYQMTSNEEGFCIKQALVRKRSVFGGVGVVKQLAPVPYLSAKENLQLRPTLT